MRTVLAAVAATMLAGVLRTDMAVAQPTALAGPVTRILAIGTFVSGADMSATRSILPTEVRDTVNLYLAGRIDQWFSLADRRGVVFVLNVTDLGEARALLEALPLGQAHLMHFDLFPLAPLAPLRALPGMTAEKP